MDKNKFPLESIQAARFDECYDELSYETQKQLDRMIEKIKNNLSGQAGEKSVKSLIYAIALLDMPLYKPEEKDYE